MVQNKQNQSGFALLITLLLLAVVITVTLSIVDLTTRQVRLAVDSRDAEIAFQAASAGVECARRVAFEEKDKIKNGEVLDFSCFGGGTPRRIFLDNEMKHYSEIEFDWDRRCTVIDLYVVNNEEAEDQEIIPGMKDKIANYPEDDLICSAGSTCHVVVSAGYNVPCDNRERLGILKRELLLEF